MAKRRRKSSGKKRTITPEHLAKMQEGRQRAKVHRSRMSELSERGLNQSVYETKTERMLKSVARKG